MWKLKTLKRHGLLVSCFKQNTKCFNLKRNQFLECQSKTLKIVSKLSLTLNFQSHWRPAGRNFSTQKMGGLCFQVLGQGVFAPWMPDAAHFPYLFP